MAILLIRHGETPGNRDRIIQFPETPLSDRGLEQAARLGDRLAGEPIDEIWVSDHMRAYQTAEAIGRTTGVPLRVLADLGERSLGELRGKPYSELGFDPFVPGYQPPGGENWDVFHARVDRAWAEIERRYLERLAEGREAAHFAVVTHGLVLRSLFERLLLKGASLARYANAEGHVSIANTAVSYIESTPRAVDDGGASNSRGALDGRGALDSRGADLARGAFLARGALDHRIALFACTAHLDEATAPRANPNVGM